MRQRIEQCLIDTQPAPDPVAAALGALPTGVAAVWFDRPLIPAAVLVPLVTRGEQLTVLLTRRTAHLKDHAGEISFPGGRTEPGDAGVIDTALREAREEVGLDPDQVCIAGFLEPLAVVTGFAVTPVVGFVAAEHKLVLDPYEVEEAFEVPLDFLLDSRNLVPISRNVRGVEARFYEYRYGERRIWGATAIMLKQFIDLISKNK